MEFKQIEQVKNQFESRNIGIENIPKEILCKLFLIAIKELDSYKNLACIEFYNEDERDAMDIFYDQNFIIDDLFSEAIEIAKITEIMGDE